jgi:arylsulfatase A-like enzyme
VKVTELEYLTFAFRREAVDFINANAHGPQPFFLYLPFSAIHVPFEAPQEYADKFAGQADVKRQYLSAMLSAKDDAIGDVLAAIRNQGIDSNTLIIYLSDNGGEWAPHADNRPLRGSKFRIWEGGVRVPMMMRWTGKPWSNGRVVTQLASSLDVMPTVLGAATAPVASDLDGINLLPQLERKSWNADRPLYFRYGPEWAILQGDWKLLHEVDPETMEHREWLFNLSDDLSETTNLIDAEPDLTTKLRRTYNRWAATLPEPLWYGWPRGMDN